MKDDYIVASGPARDRSFAWAARLWCWLEFVNPAFIDNNSKENWVPYAAWAGTFLTMEAGLEVTCTEREHPGQWLDGYRWVNRQRLLMHRNVIEPPKEPIILDDDKDVLSHVSRSIKWRNITSAAKRLNPALWESRRRD